MRFPDEQVKILWRDTYLAMIKNSVGTKMFRNTFARVGNKKQDILRNGDLSCAVFVSTILTFVQLLDRPRTTVLSTEKTMQKLGWEKIARPCSGAVIVWEKKIGASGEGHRHIGFSLGGQKAISNNPEKGYPIVHHFTFGTKDKKPFRRIEAMYWHPKLNKN